MKISKTTITVSNKTKIHTIREVYIKKVYFRRIKIKNLVSNTEIYLHSYISCTQM